MDETKISNNIMIESIIAGNGYSLIIYNPLIFFKNNNASQNVRKSLISKRHYNQI